MQDHPHIKTVILAGAGKEKGSDTTANNLKEVPLDDDDDDGLKAIRKAQESIRMHEVHGELEASFKLRGVNHGARSGGAAATDAGGAGAGVADFVASQVDVIHDWYFSSAFYERWYKWLYMYVES